MLLPCLLVSWYNFFFKKNVRLNNIHSFFLDSLALKGDNGADSYSTYFVIIAAAPGATTNYTAAPPTTSAPGANNNNAAGSGTASGSGAAPSSTQESAATSLKAGLFGAGIAGVVALLI